MTDVTAWQCAFWGLFGAAAVEGLDILTAIRNSPDTWPWTLRKQRGDPRPSINAVLVSFLIRIVVSCGLAGATGATQPTTAMSAIAVGIAAPVILERIARVPNLESTALEASRNSGSHSAG